MRISRPVQASVFFSLIFCGVAPAVKVEIAIMTKTKPAACDPANPPQAATTFLTTDKEAYLFFYVTGTQAGDRFASFYFTPSGEFYAPPSGEWRPLAEGGDRCFLDNPFKIAGEAPGSLPGAWRVLVTYNGSPLFSLNYTISAPASPTCSFSLSPASQAVAGGGGSHTVAVSTGAGCAWSATSNANWVTIGSGSSGTGSGSVAYTVAPNPGPEPRTGTITVVGRTGTNSTTTLTHQVNQAAAAPATLRPVISAGGVLNGADYTPDIAPGMMVSVFGQNLAPRTTAARTVPLPSELDGVSVEVTEPGKAALRAPLYFVSANQINIQMPFGITAASVQLRVRTAQGVSDAVTVPIVSRAPRLFTRTMDGKGEPILLHASDYSWVSAEAPAAPGEYLVLLLTGLGEVTPGVEAGRPGGDDRALGPINRVTAPVRVSFGGQRVEALFAGLMPGYPGIYQVNFQAPAGLSGGLQPIVVSVGDSFSQAGVAAAVRENRPVLASGTAGPAGGLIRGGGVSLSIPAGAFAENRSIVVYEADRRADPSGVRLSPVVRISGLPSDIAAPLTVSLDLFSPPPPGQTLEAVVQTEGGVRGIGFHTFPATLEGARLTFQIPATERTIAAASSAAQPHEAVPSTPPREVDPAMRAINAEVYARTAPRDLDSPSGRFRINFRPTQVSEATIRQVGQVLDEAYRKLQGLGLDWSLRAQWPVRVLVEPFAGAHADYWGMEQTSFWGVNSSNLVLNATRLAEEGVTRNFRGTIGHELFHLMQELYDPRTRYRKSTEAGAWLWFCEALSTWFESIMVEDDAYIPDVLREDNFGFLLRHGLEYPPGDQRAAALHGYGASMFLRYLAKEAGGNARLAGVLKRMASRTSGSDPQPQLSPVAALRLEYPNLSDLWFAFVRAYMERRVYGVPFPEPGELGGGATIKAFKDASDSGTTFEWAAQDLSAKLFQLKFLGSWPAGTTLTLTLTDPEGQAEAILYKRPDWQQLAVFRDSYTVRDADAFSQNKGMLYVMVTNGRARAPYTGERPLKLTVTFTLGKPFITTYERKGLATVNQGPYGTYQATLTVRVSGPANGLRLESEKPDGTGTGWLSVHFAAPAPPTEVPVGNRYTVAVSVAEPKCLRNCLDPKEWELVARSHFDDESPKPGTSFSKTVTVAVKAGAHVSVSFKVVFSYRHIPGTKTEAQGATLWAVNIWFLSKANFWQLNMPGSPQFYAGGSTRWLQPWAASGSPAFGGPAPPWKAPVLRSLLPQRLLRTTDNGAAKLESAPPRVGALQAGVLAPPG